MKIISVMVTYNRIDMLQESLESLLKQSYIQEKIIVVDNNSSDGTKEYLKKKELKNPRLEVVTLAENIGGAGGFYIGIKKAMEYECDWVWLMDDDTITNSESLKNLVIEKECRDNQNIGFICSKVLWSNNQVHKLNIPLINYSLNGLPFNSFEPYLLVKRCSFVSVLINTKVIKKVGLPYKDFFIWCDDIEYTERITDKGYLGLYTSKSTVIHKTKTNYESDFFSENTADDWKYFYGIRNQMFLTKRKCKTKYLLKIFYNLIFLTTKVCFKSKEKKTAYIKTITKATLSSLFFNPKIEYIEEVEND